MICNKENFRRLRSFFDQKRLQQLSGCDVFVKQVVSGTFTVEDTSKYNFLLVLKKALNKDYVLFDEGNVTNKNRYNYNIKIEITIGKGAVKDIIGLNAANLNTVVSNANCVCNVDSVEKTGEGQIKVVKATCYGPSDSDTDLAMELLSNWANEQGCVTLKQVKCIPVTSNEQSMPSDLDAGLTTGQYIGAGIIMVMSILTLIILNYFT